MHQIGAQKEKWVYCQFFFVDFVLGTSTDEQIEDICSNIDKREGAPDKVREWKKSKNRKINKRQGAFIRHLRVNAQFILNDKF